MFCYSGYVISIISSSSLLCLSIILSPSNPFLCILNSTVEPIYWAFVQLVVWVSYFCFCFFFSCKFWFSSMCSISFMRFSISLVGFIFFFLSPSYSSFLLKHYYHDCLIYLFQSILTSLISVLASCWDLPVYWYEMISISNLKHFIEDSGSYLNLCLHWISLTPCQQVQETTFSEFFKKTETICYPLYFPYEHMFVHWSHSENVLCEWVCYVLCDELFNYEEYSDN